MPFNRHTEPIMTRFAIYNIIVIAALLAASGCSKSTGPAAAGG